LLGYSREEFASLTVSDFEAVQDNSSIGVVLEKIRREGTASFDTVHRTKGGEKRSMLVTLRMIELASRPMILALHRDITDHKRAEQSLQETTELFTLFMQYSPVYTFIKEIDGDQSRVVEISDNFVEMVGRPSIELRGRTMYELFPAEFAEKITRDDIAIVQGGKAVQLDEDLGGKQYTTIKFPISREGKNNLIAGFTIDVTERKRVEAERLKLEKQLLHAQKLESLGVLAGGIAHDFNNILMAIMGNADLALMRINKESPAVDNLHKIEQAAARAADLAKQMLAYSGKGKFVVETIDLNRLLEDMLHMLEVSISKKAVLRLNPYHPLPGVDADATQIRQIIMNLVINASEAIGDKSGVIAITTGCMDCDKSYLKDVWLDENIIEGLYVYLEIADTGCGMDKDTLTKLFDPFFTTKFTGRGLGMAAVLGIIRGHKGAIKVYSEPGKGSSFKILLPASSRPAELFNGEKHKDNWQGHGTVLLVDDEETVRGIGAEMLKELGFSTVTANDGREALEIFKNRPDIRFVILDLTMPHMDGEQCFRELRRMNPDVKVIMSSGYNEQEVTQKFVGKGLAGFIQKPCRLSVLKDAIREMGSATA
jgi:PAS domain S-box-containing protein